VEEGLVVITKYVVLVIDAMALVVLAYGTVEAFAGVVRGVFVASATSDEERSVWLRYARRIVAGLTFQLAADIIETSIAPGWNDIGRLAAIAAIRTFLNYFLERDVVEVRGLKKERQASPE
jgi:uncharacterized membrane protein